MEHSLIGDGSNTETEIASGNLKPEDFAQAMRERLGQDGEGSGGFINIVTKIFPNLKRYQSPGVESGN